LNSKSQQAPIETKQQSQSSIHKKAKHKTTMPKVISKKFATVIHHHENAIVQHVDEEASTEFVMPVRKPDIVSAPVVQARRKPSLEKEEWWRMNHDFALDREDNEEDTFQPVATPKSVANNIKPMSTGALLLDDDVWKEINSDFACESHISEPATAVTKATTAQIERPIGDYGVWWE
jgi:hypothetical protein